ncbi:MAG: flippase-like domain-containing protein [Candidatus Cloacimonetes bacterium]|nr:flippase-like domain-containing protein [Candidatus Cloacimonadota bacterium]
MEKLIKNRYFYFIKIIITAIILYFIFRKINFHQLYISFIELKLSSILLILFTAGIKIFIEYLNWGSYLKLNPEYKPKKSEIFRSHMIGHALRFLIPGGHAVVGKMFYVNNEKKLSFMSMGVEKFFQIWINLLFAGFAAIFYFRSKFILPTILAFIFIIFLPFIIYLLKHLDRKQNLAIYFKQYWKIIPRIFVMQIVYMFLTIFQYFILLNNFVSFHIFSAIVSVPLILFSNLIPITYAGLGLREKFAIEILSKYNISSETAITISLTVFIFNVLFPALIGLYYIINSKRKVK